MILDKSYNIHGLINFVVRNHCVIVLQWLWFGNSVWTHAMQQSVHCETGASSPELCMHITTIHLASGMATQWLPPLVAAPATLSDI